MAIPPTLVTEVAEFVWNHSIGMFESKIFQTSTDTGVRTMTSYYATPPEKFLLSFTAQVEAIQAYHDWQAGQSDNVLPFSDDT